MRDREVCGIVGALELRKRDAEVILPHEDVIPAIVADRLAMMATPRPTSSPSCSSTTATAPPTT